MNENAKKWTERNIQKQEGLDRQKETYEKNGREARYPEPGRPIPTKMNG